MTVIRPNSISGITSLTAHRGSIDFYAHDGSAATFNNINSNVTSGVSTFASLNITGDLDVGGALTYEDVTNVDSIGVVTARNGIHVTGGQVGVNTTSPAEKLDVWGTIRASEGTSQYMHMYPVAGAGYFDVSNSTSYPSIIFRQIGSGGTQERLRITSAGYVGINETSPDTYLHVKTGTDSALAKLEQTATNGRAQINYLSPHGDWYQGIIGGNNTGDYLIYTSQAKNLTFHTSGELRQKIQSDGKVIIGGNANQTANRNLSIVAAQGNSNEAQIGLQPTNSSGSYNPEVFISAIADGAYGAHVYFKTRDTSGNRLERLRITSAGDMGLGTGSPTARLDVRRGDTDGKIAEFHQSTGYGIQIRSSESVATIRAEYNQALVFETGTTATERLRITSTARFGFNTANPPRDYCFHSGQADTNIQITNNTTGVDDSAGSLIQQDGNDLYIWNKENSFMSLGTNAVERVRISSAGEATFKYKVKIGESYGGGEILSVGKSSGTGYMAFHSGGANMGFIGYADQLISGGASNELGIRSQDDILFATGGSTERLRLTTAGYAYFGSYPTTHTVMSGSPIKVRSGAGAWGISIGMRYSQNDYGYIGFSDMNGTENLGDIHVNRTGTNTGRMAFSTNNGSGSLQRLRIEPSGNVIITDDGTIRDQRLPLVITGRGFGHGTTSQGTTQDAIYLTAGASGNYSTLTLTVDKSSWGSVAYEIHAAAYNGRHLHRVGGFYQNGNNISGDHGTTTASSGSSFSISAPASQQFRMTISGNTWTHPSAWVRLVLSGSGFLRSDLISFAWS